LNNLVKLDDYSAQLKDLYIRSDEAQKVSMFRVLDTILNCEDIDDISLDIKKIDKITNLANRESLMNDISMLKHEAMLIILHINQVEAIKQLYGFKVVKEIITDKAETLKHLIKKNEASLYNLNIQEFAILVRDKRLFDKYLSILHFSIFNNIDSSTYSIGGGKKIIADFSAGISYGKKHLYHTTNVALQEAILSKANYKVYKVDPKYDEVKKLSLDKFQIYKTALHDGNIVPYFQPIVDAKDFSVMKYEALARLQLDDGEIVLPYDFLNSAIEDKTFEFFTRQMMQKVFNIYSKTYVEIAINLTYENIKSQSMLGYIKNRLDKYGGERVTFEIVETEEIRDYTVVENFICTVKEYGCKISIDDFGSGYSNFTNLIKLNIDFIKIDGTLISKLLIDEKAKIMVQGIVQFAKSINIKTIAEFVSSKEISDCVRNLGIDYLQGYHHGKPKRAKEYGLA